MAAPHADARRRERLVLALAVVAVLGVSAALVHSRELAVTESWADPPRHAGGAPVLALGSLLPPAILPARIRVAVVHDSASDGFYGGPSTLQSLTAAWVAELREVGADARVVDAGALGAGVDADVIVVPSTPCLSPSTFEAIAGDRRGSLGLILTRHTGLRDDGCTAVGAGLLIELTGASRLDTLESRDDAYVTFPAGGTLSVEIPPGARMAVRPGNHVALRRVGRDGYWSDYELDPAPAAGLPLLDAAVVHAERRDVRTVYWGFELTDVSDRPWSRAILRLLLRNSVAWAARHPFAEIEAWPASHRAAAVIAQDVEDRFANARHALDTLRATGVRGTFFLVSDLARQHGTLVEDLAEHGEIGTHSENHRLLGGLDSALQARRLERTQQAIEEIIGARVAGLRPPEEQFDAATLQAWRQTGGSYVFASNDGRTASPELLMDSANPVVLLGRVGYDDYAVLRRAGVADPDSQAVLYLREYERMRALGGLYMFSYHSNLLAGPEHVGALGLVARRLAGDGDTWLTTAGEIASWWRKRGAVRMEAHASAQRNSLAVRVWNTGPAPVDSAVLRVVLGARRSVGSISIGRMLDASPGEVRIALPRLEPQSESMVRITLEQGAR